MPSPAVDEFGYIVHPTENLDEWGILFTDGWSEEGRFRIGVYLSETLNEALTLTDLVLKTPIRELSETILHTDLVPRNPFKEFAEVMILDDLVLEWWFGELLTLVESMTLTEYGLKVDMGRSLYDGMMVGASKWIDEWGRVLPVYGLTEYGKYWGEGGEWGASTEYGDRVVGFSAEGEILERTLVRTFLETVSHYHNWPLRYIDGRVITDIVHLDDIGLFEQLKMLVEALALTDNTLTKDALKNVVESLATLDRILKNPTPAILQEVLGLTDVLIRGKELLLSELLVLTDVSVEVHDLVRELLESMAQGEVFQKVVVPSILVEALSLVDQIVLGGEYYKLLAEALAMSDSILKGVVVYKIETVALPDVVVRGVVKADLAEAVGLTDLLERISKNYKEFLEALAVTDVINFNPLWYVYEGVALTDVALKNPQLADLVETFGALVDSVQKHPGPVRVETFVLSDVFERSMNILVRELVTLTDIPNFFVIRELEEVLDLLDILKRKFKSKVRKMSGTLTRTKLGSFIKRKVHNTFKQRYKDTTFWEGEDEE